MRECLLATHQPVFRVTNAARIGCTFLIESNQWLHKIFGDTTAGILNVNLGNQDCFVVITKAIPLFPGHSNELVGNLKILV
jgi:hypothetical protein